MNSVRRPKINKTADLIHQNAYTTALTHDYVDHAFDEERAPLNKGDWRKKVFSADVKVPMDLEVGTGNGLHFAQHAVKNPSRLLVGLEIKYKPLIQSIRRALQAGCKNVAIARYHAFNLDELFAVNELDNIFIHFPDPWVSPRKPKNRFVNKANLQMLAQLQKVGSCIDFKTDSKEYFLWALEEIQDSCYQIEFQTMDLHRSIFAQENFITAFERIFIRQGMNIHFARLRLAKKH